jgi:GAF domain-containing protein
MKKAPILENEEERLKILESKNILNSERNPKFDEITEKACRVLNMPISTISIIDKDTEHYKSCSGIAAKSGPRDISFCGHTLADKHLLVCEDTLEDDRFKDNPNVTREPFIRFYAGMRLIDKKSRMPLGVFCVKDKKPRKFSVLELAEFISLATEAEAVLNEY